MTPISWAVAPGAAHARGVGCRGGLPRAASYGTASPRAAAVRAHDIWQLRLQLPFQCRAWPTEETKKGPSAQRVGSGESRDQEQDNPAPAPRGSSVALRAAASTLRTETLKTRSSCASHKSHTALTCLLQSSHPLCFSTQLWTSPSSRVLPVTPHIRGAALANEFTASVLHEPLGSESDLDCSGS